MVTSVTPDFSGAWTLDRDASALSPALGESLGGASMRIAHHDSRFAAHLALVLDEQPFDVTFVLPTDSDGDGGAAPDPDARLVTSLRWDRDVLVATFREHGPYGEVVICFRYSLEDDGRRLRAAEQVRGGGRDQDNLWIYVKENGVTAHGS